MKFSIDLILINKLLCDTSIDEWSDNRQIILVTYCLWIINLSYSDLTDTIYLIAFILYKVLYLCTRHTNQVTGFSI